MEVKNETTLRISAITQGSQVEMNFNINTRKAIYFGGTNSNKSHILRGPKYQPKEGTWALL